MGKPLHAAAYAYFTDYDNTPAQKQLVRLDRTLFIRGWTWTEYVDRGAGRGFFRKEKRPQYEEMRAAIRRGEHSALVVWSLARLVRTVPEALVLLKECADAGVQFLSLQENLDTAKPSGSFLDMAVLLHDLKGRILKERLLCVQASSGKPTGRPPKQIDLRPAVAMIRDGYTLRAVSDSLGVSRNTLKRHLKRAGYWPRELCTQPSVQHTASVRSLLQKK